MAIEFVNAKRMPDDLGQRSHGAIECIYSDGRSAQGFLPVKETHRSMGVATGELQQALEREVALFVESIFRQ